MEKSRKFLGLPFWVQNFEKHFGSRVCTIAQTLSYLYNAISYNYDQKAMLVNLFPSSSHECIEILGI